MAILKNIGDIETELKTLTEDQEKTKEALSEILSLIDKYELGSEIRKLLEEKISNRRSSLLSALRNTPRSIQKPLPRPTRIENAKKKIDLLVISVTDFIQNIEEIDPKSYKFYTVKAEYSPSYFAIVKGQGNQDVGNKFL
jgi:hypothetical protein